MSSYWPRQILFGSRAASSSSWRFSAGAARAVLRCESFAGPAVLYDASQRALRTWNHPLDALAWLDIERRAGNPENARWLGFISYDLGRLFERIPNAATDDLRTPLFIFSLHAPDVEADVDARMPPLKATPADIRSTFSPQGYRQAVARAIEYIRAGDIFQVNLSQRLSVAATLGPRDAYANLCRASPMPYAALLDYGSMALVCNSPELFFSVSPDRHIATRPIKGTRPAGPGMREQLLLSAKDQAELNMIVDLERNDLGRVCEIGSIRVTRPREIEEYPTLLHGVATIEGQLRKDVGLVALLRGIFPGGSITGAPKIRSMEIIEELEPVRRGPYCGAIGYLAADGSCEFNIAIRTMIYANDQVHIPVGGGIVADSDPQAEYEETWVKARALVAGLGLTRPRAF